MPQTFISKDKIVTVPLRSPLRRTRKWTAPPASHDDYLHQNDSLRARYRGGTGNEKSSHLRTLSTPDQHVETQLYDMRSWQHREASRLAANIATEESPAARHVVPGLTP